MDAGGDWQGRIIDGRYAVEGLLGKGGMGFVLRARHKFTGSRVAVKLLHPHMRLQGDLAERFLAEARAPAAIGHPGIVEVMDAGITPEGELYLVMELLQGEPMRDLMVRERLPLAQVCRIGAELLGALGAAHAAGFIHRDLKPENVFLTSSGAVKLLDFGIAKVLAEGIESKGETAVGSILGTLWYMAPEQLRDASSVDLRADLWAVGVILFELVTGALPYKADTFGKMLISMMEAPPAPLGRFIQGAPPALEQLMARALAREPERRFQSAAEMAAALTALATVATVESYRAVPGAAQAQAQVAVGTMPSGAVGSVPFLATAAATPAPQSAGAPKPSRKKWLIAGGAGLVAVIGIAAAIAASSGGGAPAKPQQARVEPSPSPSPPPPQPDLKPLPLPLPPVPVASSAPAPPPPPPPPPPLKPAVTSAPAPAPVDARSDAQACADGCALLQRCGLYVDNTCQPGCSGNPAMVTCARHAHDCNAASSCVMAAFCGNVGPHGGASCNQAAQCEGACGANGGCACGCVHNMSSRHATALLWLNQCAFACGGNPQCISQRCGAQLQRCAKE